MLGCLLFLFIHSAPAADKSGSYAIWGAGQKSCYNYSKTRNTGDDSFYRYYLMGYLTAYNAQTPETYRISAANDLIAILAWFDDYCAGKPVHSFDQAVMEYIIEQHPKRHRRAKSARGR